MARKSTENEVVMNDDMEQPVLEETKAVDDPWKVTRDIMLPRAQNGEANYQIVSVNGRVFKVMRGKTVSVPLPIAQVIENSFIDADRADEFIEKSVFE